MVYLIVEGVSPGQRPQSIVSPQKLRKEIRQKNDNHPEEVEYLYMYKYILRCNTVQC